MNIITAGIEAMLPQYSEIELMIIDLLADGSVPIPLLLRELRRQQQPWDPATAMLAFLRLSDQQLIRITQSPGGPLLLTPAVETLKPYLAHFPVNIDPPHYWVELTDQGQVIWEGWQKGRA